MALLQIHSYRALDRNLGRIASALERIADTLEGKYRRRVFPLPGPEDEAELLNQTDEDFAALEELEARLTRSRGVEPGPDEDLAAQLQAAKDGRG